MNKEDTKTIKEEKVKKYSEMVLKHLPTLQSALWKILKINRRDMSRIIKLLEDNGLIKRIKVGGTYMVEKIENEKADFSVLLSDCERFSPCTGCRILCEPEKCTMIHTWLMEEG